MNELDMLRAEIESGERFKTTFQGYDKKQVSETVTQLVAENSDLSEQLDRAKAENNKLKKQLRDLQRELAELSQAESSASSQEENSAAATKLEAKYKAQLEELTAQLKEARQEAKAAKEAAAIAGRKLSESPAESGGEAVSEAATPPRTRVEIGARYVVEDLKNEIARLNEEKRKRGLRIAELEELLQQEKDTTSGKLAMLTSLNDNMSALLQEKLDELNEVAAGWKDAFTSTAM